MRRATSLSRAGLLIAVAALGARAQTLSAEVLLPSFAQRDAYWPAAALGGGTGLVVWQAGRQEAGDLRAGLRFSADLVAARVAPDGSVLDAAPVVVSQAPDLQERPRVAFGAGGFFVVWQDLRNRRDWDVYGARVSAAGAVLDPDGILISGGPRSQVTPRVAWDGTSFVVSWADLRGERAYEVYAARVGTDGVVQDPAGILISSGGDHRFNPSVASNGQGTSLILWSQNQAGFGATPWAGAALLSGTSVTQTYTFSPSAWEAGGRVMGPCKGCTPLVLAAGPSGYLAGWSTRVPLGRGNGTEQNDMALFNAAGERVTTLGTFSGRAELVVEPDLVWDGTAYVAAWGDQPTPAGQRSPHDLVRATVVSAAGQPSGTVVEVAGTAQMPAKIVRLASDGAGRTLLVYERHPATGAAPIRIGLRWLQRP